LATPDHLHYLVKTLSKNKHLLTSSDLKREDKMNYSAGEKMCSLSVINNLKESANTDGNCLFKHNEIYNAVFLR